MKKLKFICMVAVCGLLLSGCQGDTPIDTQGIAGDIKDIMQQKVVSFFEGDDLSEKFGINKSRQEEIEKSIQSYIDSYKIDEEAINKTKEAVYEVLEEAKDFSPEEVDKKIANIFKNQD